MFNQHHHETLVVIAQHHREIAQGHRAANAGRPRRIRSIKNRQFDLRIPRWRIRLILEPTRSVACYNSVSQTL